MTKKSRTELLEIYRPGYKKATHKEKRRILSALIEATGYTRKHAITLLNHAPVEPRGKSGRRPKLSKESIDALIAAWHLGSRICSKRLVPFLPELLAELEKSRKLDLTEAARQELLCVSASTVDRVLKSERRKYSRSPSTTKRASLVKSQVPVRTFTEWNLVTPGFFELDTVSHCASSTSGSYLSTLNMTDIATCWTEPLALLRKGSVDVISALEQAVDLIPFPLLGIDCDNGSEFLNQELINWCETKTVTFTRSREYKKNDQAWIEEKNGSVVRKYAGRGRFEGRKTWNLLRKLYSQLRLYINFFQPSQKLLSKHRQGAKTYKKHDRAKTPYQRVLESEHVPEIQKEKLRKQRSELNMVDIKQEIDRLQDELYKQAVNTPNPLIAVAAAQRMATYKFLNEPVKDKSPRTSESANITKELRDIVLYAEPGTLIVAKDLLSIAPRARIDCCLHRFLQEGIVKRVSWGRYQTVGNDQIPASR